MGGGRDVHEAGVQQLLCPLTTLVTELPLASTAVRPQLVDFEVVQEEQPCTSTEGGLRISHKAGVTTFKAAGPARNTKWRGTGEV